MSCVCGGWGGGGGTHPCAHDDLCVQGGRGAHIHALMMSCVCGVGGGHTSMHS